MTPQMPHRCPNPIRPIHHPPILLLLVPHFSRAQGLPTLWWGLLNGGLTRLMATPPFWLALVLAIWLALLPRIAAAAWSATGTAGAARRNELRRLAKGVTAIAPRRRQRSSSRKTMFGATQETLFVSGAPAPSTPALHPTAGLGAPAPTPASVGGLSVESEFSPPPGRSPEGRQSQVLRAALVIDHEGGEGFEKLKLDEWRGPAEVAVSAIVKRAVGNAIEATERGDGTGGDGTGEPAPNLSTPLGAPRGAGSQAPPSTDPSSWASTADRDALSPFTPEAFKARGDWFSPASGVTPGSGGSAVGAAGAAALGRARAESGSPGRRASRFAGSITELIMQRLLNRRERNRGFAFSTEESAQNEVIGQDMLSSTARAANAQRSFKASEGEAAAMAAERAERKRTRRFRRKKGSGGAPSPAESSESSPSLAASPASAADNVSVLAV